MPSSLEEPKEDLSSEIPNSWSIQQAPFSQLKLREGWSGANPTDPFERTINDVPKYHNTMRNKPQIPGERTGVITNSTTYWKQKTSSKPQIAREEHRIPNSERLDKYFK